MRRRNRSGLWWLAGGVAVGTALGWLTAPRRGNWFRNQARQKLARWSRLSRRTLDKRCRDLENRMQGSVAELRQVWAGRQHYVDANTLVDQVRSAIGRQFDAILDHVNLNAVGHTVYLHGYVNGAETRERLVKAILAVEGAEDVQAEGLHVRVLPAVPPPAR